MSDFALSDTYPLTINELNNSKASIEQLIKEFKDKISSGANTFQTENKIKDQLQSYTNKISKLSDEYTKSFTAKNNLPDTEFSRRMNEINTQKTIYQTLKANFDSEVNAKYSYKPKNNGEFEPYKEDESMKDMNNKQLFDMQQKKLKDQDQDIDKAISLAKSGKQQARELKDELSGQVKLLGDVEQDVFK
jgi:hypothetical protein